MTEGMTKNDAVPDALLRSTSRWSFAWLLPLAALLVVMVVVWAQVNRERGVMISIRFNDAAGLEPDAGIVYRGMRVGVVRDVRLSSDFREVVVRAELSPTSAGLAREGTEFWVVQPEVSLQRVAGLETILGPRYIGVRPGDAGGAQKRSFEGLGSAPRLSASSADALTLVLSAQRVGALARGSPVLYRDMRVGAVRGIELSPDAGGVRISVQIGREHAGLIREKTRFWYAGGVGVDWGLFSGLRVQADSLDSLIEGSVAFATPRKPGGAIESGAGFELESSPPDGWTKWRPEIDWSADP